MRKMNERFRGFLPVVIDIETGGLNPKIDAILEIAIVILKFNGNILSIYDVDHYHINPTHKTRISAESKVINKIEPDHPFRLALEENQALIKMYKKINDSIKDQDCVKAVLVGHNSWFDLSFLLEANKRCNIQNFPLHSFTSFDTATLSALTYGQTVLAQALNSAHIKFNDEKAHSALYDAIKTAQLFCKITNKFSI